MADIESTPATAATAPAGEVDLSSATPRPAGMQEVGMSNEDTMNTMNAPDPRQSHQKCLCLGAYTWPILGFLVLFVMLAVALGLSAEALSRSDEAVAISEAALFGGKGVGESTYIPVPNEPTGQAALVPASPPAEPTPPPSPRPQSDAPTDVPTPTHEQRPKWFQILHADFQKLSLFHDENGVTTSQLAEAALFCYQQEMFMCTYDVICPNGKGNPPFKGGPPYTTNKDSLDETQWVPYYWSNVHPNPVKNKDEDGNYIQHKQNPPKQWAQIGHIPDGKGGSGENSNGLCWDYNEWSNYDAVNIEDVWSEETRVWMLCCSDPADENEKDLVVE
mmetsp:Transcript_22591/g.50244  ORF Transcript_22591/g.50244 Transcript_22591/m.50244 type:complete len:333 (+) Transcript_22591:336-1334(+)